MTLATLGTWHELSAHPKHGGPRSPSCRQRRRLLAVHTPQIGKVIALKYLCAARHVFGNESFRYVRELTGPRDAALEFEVEIDGIEVNGVDLITWNDDGRIVEFKVFVRPLKAINLVHQKMAAMLQASR